MTTAKRTAVYKLAAKRAGKRARTKLFMTADYRIRGREAGFLRHAYRTFVVAELAAARTIAA